MDTENAYMKNNTGIGALGNLAVSSQFPLRPGHGTMGKRIAVYANYFKLVTKPNLSLVRYNIDVSPEPRPRHLRRVLEILCEQPTFAGVATDFKSMIISSRPLDIPDSYQVSIPFRGEGEDEPAPKAATYTVKVATQSSIPVSELVKYLSATSPGPAFPGKEELLQALNILLAFYPVGHGGVSNIKEKHFSTDSSPNNRHNITDIGGGIDALRGFFQSVRPATGGLILNVNVTHGIFLHPGPLTDLYYTLGSDKKEKIQKKLSLIRVKVSHIPPKISKKTGESFPRIKTILKFASPGDGRGPGATDPHPPRVDFLGAGPKQVAFWIGDDSSKDEEGKGKGKAKPKPKGPTLPVNDYISVYDYFRIS